MFEEMDSYEEPESESASDGEGELDPDSALVRLHAALGELDDALFAATRALEDAFGRPASSEPHRALPMKELTTLGEQMRRTRKRRRGHEARQSIIDIAGKPPIHLSDELEELEEDTAASDQQVSVAPSGPIRVD